MMNVSFVDEFQQEISFDSNGDPPAWSCALPSSFSGHSLSPFRYDILNYEGPSGFRLAGDFRQTAGGIHRLEMSRKQLMFYHRRTQMPESVCSKPCLAGQWRRQTTACCWLCENCKDNQILNAVTGQCQDCPFGQWPADNRSSCFRLKDEYPSIAGPVQMAAIAFATAGIISALLCIVVFVNYNSTPVVKSTTRELSYIILGGILTCYLCTYAMLAQPSDVVCFISRTFPPIAFSAIYAALFTKTNRIARILAGSKKRILTKKPRFLSTFSQVVITWTLVGVQCVVVAVSVIEEMPRAGFDPHFLPRRLMLICSSSTRAFLAPFVWNFILTLFCTLYAFKTRNLPENFNEAKFIGFTMYCTLVTWGAFLVLYVNAVNKALTASFTFSLSAWIALSLLFFPKVFIILLRPEKNVRSSYTTTKLIRCHFGNSQALNESKQFSSSKTRNSSQSLSLGGCPTRTASLHVTNHNGNNNNNNNNNNGSSSAAGTPTTTTVQFQTSGGSPRRDAAAQTDVSIISQGGIASRFTRTFSVMGGTSAGSVGGLLSGGHHHGGKRERGVSCVGEQVASTLATPTREEQREKKSRRKNLDDDVMQLIDSCRRYQDERLLINPSTIQNMLLEESEESLAEDRSGEKVSQLLAGTVRTLAQTVSRTTGSGTPSNSVSEHATPVPRQRNEPGGSIRVKQRTPVDSVFRTAVTRSSLKGSSSSSEARPTHRVEFAQPGKNGSQRRMELADPDSSAPPPSQHDDFEEMLLSRGIQPVQFSHATQL